MLYYNMLLNSRPLIGQVITNILKYKKGSKLNGSNQEVSGGYGS